MGGEGERARKRFLFLAKRKKGRRGENRKFRRPANRKTRGETQRKRDRERGILDTGVAPKGEEGKEGIADRPS